MALIQNVLSGVAFVAVTLAATYAGVYFKTHQSEPTQNAHPAVKKQFKKVKPISVPVIRDGELKGYVSAEFSYLTAEKGGHGQQLDPESYIMDEAFRLMYSNTSFDFTHIERLDIDAMTKQITINVNARMGANDIEETLVRNLTFVARDDLPH